MVITSLKLYAQSIAGNPQGKGLVLKADDVQEYGPDGKPTGRIVGKKYTAIFKDNGYEKVLVKIPNTSNVITAEELQAANGEIPVIFENLQGKIYRTANGEYAISCTATDVKVQKP